MSKDEHCYMFLHPISRPIFTDSKKEYELSLNRANTNSKKRPDLSCVVEGVPILNSEYKPLGSTPLQLNNNEFCLQLSFVLYDCRNLLEESRRTSNTESVGLAVLHHLNKYHIYAR
ncbi:13994_t:CDS:2 [Funneliformis caledonium]|uniref:13994_t:CDS:1 n=1 Tax=Funneliformis caledonium TaxID=1117310 RepID=A0A9N8V9G3_9GLOM|nr:13994_t:CDS:2 [Funneliformis caledonium]